MTTRPSASLNAASTSASSDEPPRCGRWKLKPFELARPVLLCPDGPLTLGEFLARPDRAVLEAFLALGPEALQALTAARIRGAPMDRPIALFGEGGYTFADALRHVEEGTPLGVRLIEAERKLVGLLLSEALDAETGAGETDLGDGPGDFVER